MKDHWSYEKQKRFAKNGERWHFVHRTFYALAEGEDEPREIYFRNDDRAEFRVLRFERVQDNPYRDYETIVNKIMNNIPFRKTSIKQETASVWSKSWK